MGAQVIKIILAFILLGLFYLLTPLPLLGVILISFLVGALVGLTTRLSAIGFLRWRHRV